MEQVNSISLPEQKRLEHTPNLSIPPMLTEDISWANLTRYVVKSNHARCNSMDVVE